MRDICRRNRELGKTEYIDRMFINKHNNTLQNLYTKTWVQKVEVICEGENGLRVIGIAQVFLIMQVNYDIILRRDI